MADNNPTASGIDLWFWCDAVGDYACVKLYSKGQYRYATKEESLKALKLEQGGLSHVPMKSK